MIAFLRQATEAKNKDAESFARASLDSRQLNATLLLAQPELPIAPGELDRDPSLLNFTNGTVDLRTGALRPHRRGDLITKMVGFRLSATGHLPALAAVPERDHGRRP